MKTDNKIHNSKWFFDFDIEEMYAQRIEYEIKKRNFRNAAKYIFILMREFSLSHGLIHKIQIEIMNLSYHEKITFFACLNQENKYIKKCDVQLRGRERSNAFNKLKLDLLENLIEREEKLNLVRKLEAIISGIPLSFVAGRLKATMNSSKDVNNYIPHEYILFSIRSKQNGYLTVFHYDDNGNIEMLFPKRKKDDVYLKTNFQITVGYETSELPGNKYVKAILTFRKIIHPEKIHFDNEIILFREINEFISSVSMLNKEEFAETTLSYKVRET
jgi:hypothetical protein